MALNLFVVFGLLGCGKNYVGQVLHEDFGMFLYDADTDLTPEMLDAIRKQELISEPVRDAFFDKVILRIGQLRQRENRLVVCQALYKEKHRELILENFPDARFILVQTPPGLIAARLARRKGSPATLAYAQKIAPYFDPPALPHVVVDNSDGREYVHGQLEKILAGDSREL